MSKLWAVFLFCGLLTPSQGLLGNIPLVSRLDKDAVENAIAGSLAKDNFLQGLVGGLVGGDQLSSLIGSSLLGGDGPVGGLLGGDGPVGGLLGGNGPVGGLLGGDGPVGGLLGGDSPVGGLLGGDGPVGGLLGGDGPVGGLLGGDGLVGGLLGGDGLVGGLLSGDGLVGGLLGGDGPVGGLLGRDGLVGGLLSGDGLVGGLPGKKGLLSAVQGLTGLKIVNFTLPQITLRFLPGIGLQLNLYTQLTIDGGSAAGGLLRVQVKANVTARARLVQDASGALKLVIEDCRTLLGDINIRVGPKVPVLDQALKGVLGNTLPKLLCPVVNTVLGVVNSLLGTVTSVLPLGALGNLQYTLGSLPVIGDKSIQQDLNLLVRDAAGNVVDQGLGQVAPVSLPPAASGVSQLGLSQTVLGAVLSLLRGTGAFDTDIMAAALSAAGSIPGQDILLSTSALRSLLPQLSTVIPESLPLALQVRSAGAPVVSLRNGKATASVAASIAVLAQRPGSPPQPLFTLDADINLNVSPSLSANKLQATLAVDSITLRQGGSKIGNINVSLLERWVKDVLEAAYLPTINKALSVGIPLPNLFNMNFEGANVDVVDGGYIRTLRFRARTTSEAGGYGQLRGLPLTQS
ncbi:BPI fold-containing family B member 3-like [Apteryx rowi]|uniref:BPI fold-containing family B member 3-like n=1 Tax=Apteryx rowi TaxID=308060 RepID=UPI000E1D235E|nr:BPI fold-containing family B member 3-like [Apteryx rowi]